MAKVPRTILDQTYPKYCYTRRKATYYYDDIYFIVILRSFSFFIKFRTRLIQMCRGTLAILVLVSYNIAVGNTFMVPEYGNNVYSIPPVERYDTDDITGRSSSMEINF